MGSSFGLFFGSNQGVGLITILETDGESLSFVGNIEPQLGNISEFAKGFFDNNDTPDIAVSESVPGETDRVFIYFGAFSDPIGPILTGNQTSMLHARDTNNDGVDELFAVDFGNGTTELKQTTFSAETNVPFVLEPSLFVAALSPEINNVSSAKLNEDAQFDFVFTVNDGGVGGVQLVLSSVAGFEEQPPTATENLASLAILAADLNQDGRDDIAFTNDQGEDNLSLLFGDGIGELPRRTNLDVGGGSNGIAAGDVNQDGIIDLVLTNDQESNNGLTVLLNKGDGTFHPPIFLLPTNPTFGVILHDVNDDGVLDIVATLNGIPGNGAAIIKFARKTVVN